MVRILVGMLCDAGLVSRNLLKVIDEVPRDAVAWSDALRNAELLCARNKKVPEFPPENACPLNTVLSIMGLRGPAGLARIPISSVRNSTERGARYPSAMPIRLLRQAGWSQALIQYLESASLNTVIDLYLTAIDSPQVWRLTSHA